MIAHVFAPRFVLLCIFVLCAVFVHFRGRIRHRFTRQLTDHSTIMAPLNALLYAFSAVPNRPLLDVHQFPELNLLRENWRTIREEGLKLFDEGYIRAAAKYNDLGFNSFFRTGWKRFYLKWYDNPLPSARTLCPKTVELVQSIPTVHGAMFALLPPGGRLVAHRDPYAGSLRYHLGLVTPNADTCRIFIDGEPYFWKDGEDMLFDETYIHYAENKSDVTRLILFCDVERPMTVGLIARFNRFMANTLVRASKTQNVEGEPVGILNRAFGYFYRVRLVGKRLKARNRFAYYAVKFAMLGGLFYWIFLT
ncbi:MAG TPA: aspartyl/asparaginyl beta-hydroxylase domain-containing protein [Burkholderiales bacterium]|nr:aspartyl/asparaginyl beta-hydroxylase domain-containing protein [Burkholderiales bacterium]